MSVDTVKTEIGHTIFEPTISWNLNSLIVFIHKAEWWFKSIKNVLREFLPVNVLSLISPE